MGCDLPTIPGKALDDMSGLLYTGGIIETNNYTGSSIQQNMPLVTKRSNKQYMRARHT